MSLNKLNSHFFQRKVLLNIEKTAVQDLELSIYKLKESLEGRFSLYLSVRLKRQVVWTKKTK